MGMGEERADDATKAQFIQSRKVHIPNLLTTHISPSFQNTLQVKVALSPQEFKSFQKFGMKGQESQKKKSSLGHPKLY